MPINFVPNDPQDNTVPMRVISPRPNRAASRAGFNFIAEQPEKAYDPATEPAGFLFWQCREAALASLEAWEDVSGGPFSTWQKAKKIDLRPDAGEKLNAFYDRSSLSFFHFTSGTKTFLSGSSTDVVAHEAGHGILDAARPELFGLASIEISAFHEAFGDCVAIITALLDAPTRAAALPLLSQKNFVEGTIETLAAGIKTVQSGHNAAVPRRALNKFKWQLPTTLPAFGSAGDGPGKLVNEFHSFGQVFTACFYDTVVNIFKGSGVANEANLLAATRTAGRLLARAIATAPTSPRFFRDVGRSMVKADEQANSGTNREAIKAAFEAHGVTLGTGAMLSPVAALAGDAPTFKAAAATLGATVKRDLLARIGSVGGKLTTSALRIGSETIAEVIHERLVPLDRVDKRLKGVMARAREAVLVGDSGGRAAILGAMPQVATTIDEAESFVRTLLSKSAIDFGDSGAPKRAPVKGAVAFSTEGPEIDAITHRIKTVGGKKVLERVRFACACHRPRAGG